MHARSALFDLYGDHLLARDGSAPVAALIRLLEPLDIRPAAVRTAVSRMVGQGWLEPVETARGPGYGLTERADVRLREAGDRIYRTRDEAWDGRWHMHVLTPLTDRAQRERIRNQLRFLAMAPISDSTWVSPRPSTEVTSLLADEGVATVTLTSTDVRPTSSLLAAFDVEGLGKAYDEWLAGARALIASADAAADDDESAFVARSQLVHGWRKFLFADPALPAELLPDDWSGSRAAAYFDEQADRLLPAASRFVDACLDPTPNPAPTQTPTTQE